MEILQSQNLAAIQDLPIVFASITGREIIDILLVALAIYIVLLFVKQTKSYFVLTVSLLLIGLNLFSQDLNLTLTRSILQPLSTFTVIIIAIVFQREIRRFFRWIMTGQQSLFSKTHTISKAVSAELAEAALYMAEKRIGGIIVFPGKQEIDDMIEGGQPLNGLITKELLLSIFDASSPGHDGAVIIENDLIKTFGAHLPLARSYNFRKAGTRHRAAAGITEDTDALALVISEERGVISLAKHGTLERIKDEESLRQLLRTLTGESEDTKMGFWHYFVLKNSVTKLIALSVALLLWIGLVLQAGVVKKEYSVPLSFQLLPNTVIVDPQSAKTQITVILEGASTDISSFDPGKVDIKIDAKNFAPGTQEIEITNTMVSIPSYLNVVTIEPKDIEIVVQEKIIPVIEETPEE